MADHDDELILTHIRELRGILSSSQGKLVKSRIGPEDYFCSLSIDPPRLKYEEAGISKLVVTICELVSNLLLEDTAETSSVSKVIVMIFEYYFLVSPILFSTQGAKLVNDLIFMRHFTKYVQSSCLSRTQAQKEIGNILAAVDIDVRIKEVELV